MGAVNHAPDSMDMLRQVRKALGDIAVAQQQGDVMKVYYMAYCMRRMVEVGRLSWSTYRVMISEEFD